jgi:hypothetical protein
MAYLHTPYGPQQVIPIEIKPRKIEGDVTNTSELEKKLKEYIDTRVNEISNVISKLPVDVTKINDLKKQIKDEIKAEISAYMCSDCVKVTDYMKDKRDFLNTFNNFVKDEFKKQISNLESRINMKGNSVMDRVTKLENEAKSLGEIITSSGLTTFQSQLTSIKSQLASGPTVAVDIKVLEQIANLEKKFMDEITRIEGKISAEIDMKLAGYKNVDTDTLSDECKKYVDKIKTALETQINDKDKANLSERTKILQRIKVYEDKLDAHISGPHTQLIKELEELSGKIGTLNAEHRNINATLDGINDKLLDLEADHRNIAGKLLTLQQLQDDFNLFKNQIYDMYNQLIIVARAILIEQGERINNANRSIQELNELVKTLMKILVKTNFMKKDDVEKVEKQMEKINNTIVRTFPPLAEGNMQNIRQNLGQFVNLQDLLKGLERLRTPSSPEMKQSFKPFALPAPSKQPALPAPVQPQPQPQPQPPAISQMDEQLRAETALLEAERIASLEEAARAEAQIIAARNEADRLAAIKKQEQEQARRAEEARRADEARIAKQKLRKQRQEEEHMLLQQFKKAKEDAERKQKDAEEKRVAAAKTLKDHKSAKARSAQSLINAQRLTDTIRDAEGKKRILDEQVRIVAARPNVSQYSLQIQSALDKQTREQKLREYLNRQCMTDDKGQCAVKTRQVPFNFEGKDLGNCPADLTCKLEKNKCVANMSNVTYRPQTDSFDLGTLDMEGNFKDLSKRCKNAVAELAILHAQQQAADEAARIAAEEEAHKAQQAALAAKAAADAALEASRAAFSAARDAAAFVQQAIADAVKTAAEKERK